MPTYLWCGCYQAFRNLLVRSPCSCRDRGHPKWLSCFLCYSTLLPRSPSLSLSLPLKKMCTHLWKAHPSFSPLKPLHFCSLLSIWLLSADWPGAWEKSISVTLTVPLQAAILFFSSPSFDFWTSGGSKQLLLAPYFHFLPGCSLISYHLDSGSTSRVRGSCQVED